MLSLLQKHDDITTPQVLDIEDDNLRKKFIRDILTDSKSSREVINVSRFYQKPKLFRHSADLLISVLQPRVLLKTCLFQTFVEDLLERAKTLQIFTKHNGACYGISLGGQLGSSRIVYTLSKNQESDILSLRVSIAQSLMISSRVKYQL